MDAVTLRAPRPVPTPAPFQLGRGAPGRATGPGRRRHRVDLHRSALAALLLATLALRLWGVRQGLPYSYNVDEATHFVPRAIAFFSQDLNPHYFLNPPAYSYLLHLVFELWFGSGDGVLRAYVVDPTSVFVVARVVAAVLGTVAVWLTYLAGARLLRDRTAGLLAAAMFGLAFLPIFYSHLALNDVPALAPVALSLCGVAAVFDPARPGRLRDYVLAGVGIGLAAATKYTGGITVVCLVAACVCDGAAHGEWRAIRGLALALALALGSFVLANPYSVLDWSAFTSGLAQQASLAAGADPVKLGTGPGGGVAYYLWTFTWGLGIGPAVAAVGGALLLLWRRRWGLAAVLIPAVIVFIAFMGGQQRYFGRWLMPVFPVVCIVGALGAVSLVRWLARARRIPVAVGGTVAALLLLTQSVVAVVHNDAVLSRPDTRNLTRAWMVEHVPAGAKVVVEPVVPDNWTSDIGRTLPWTATGERWYRYATWLSTIALDGRRLAAGSSPLYVNVDEYERVLQPSLLKGYVERGYCWVVTGSLQAGRAFADPRAAPGAIAYYRALGVQARLVYRVSPFAPRARPVPFNFDWSIDYYPRQYRRPGPAMSVYQLSGGRCASWRTYR